MQITKDQWLSGFTYGNLQEIIPELTKSDYKKLIKGELTQEGYPLGDSFGRFSLSVDPTKQQSSFLVFPIEVHPKHPEIISNTVLGENEYKKIEEGKHVLLHNNKVAYKGKGDQVYSESLYNYQLPSKVGDKILSNEQKVSILNGEKVPIEINGKFIQLEKNKNNVEIKLIPRGLNPEQNSFIENYKTHYLNATEEGRDKLNQATIKALKERYYPTQPDKEEKIKGEIGTKGELSEKIKAWFLGENNQQNQSIKKEKGKEKSLIDHADDKSKVTRALSRGLKDIHHKNEKAVSKTREIISVFSQGM